MPTKRATRIASVVVASAATIGGGSVAYLSVETSDPAPPRVEAITPERVEVPAVRAPTDVVSGLDAQGVSARGLGAGGDEVPRGARSEPARVGVARPEPAQVESRSSGGASADAARAPGVRSPRGSRASPAEHPPVFVTKRMTERGEVGQAAERLGLSDAPEQRRELPRWFVAVNAGGWGGARDPEDLEGLDAAVQTAVLMDGSTQQMARHVLRSPDTRFVLVAGWRALTKAGLEALAAPNVVAVVIGHYRAAHPYEQDSWAETVRDLRELIGRATDAPLLLATPHSIEHTYEAGRAWANRHDWSLWDGAAVFHAVNYTTFEDGLSAVRKRAGVPADEPAILLDFCGFRTGDEERARLVWKHRGRPFFRELRSAGWRGVVWLGVEDGDKAIKDRIVTGLDEHIVR